MAKRPVARVLPESRLPQLDRVFDYAIPDGMDAPVGCRVKVPIGRSAKLHTGFVVERPESTDFAGELSPLDQVLSPVSVLTEEILATATALAKRQAGGVADVLRLAVPPRAVRVEKKWLEAPREDLEPPSSPAAPEALSAAEWERLSRRGEKTVWHLTHGVSGSTPQGYLDVAALATAHLAHQRSVVMVVPDWRDISLLEDALRHHVPEDHLVVFSSDLTPSEQYSRHLRCLEGRPLVVLGSRHAVYAPVSSLGAIVVVSDGDDAHREPLAPYPHTRDVALIRAEQTGCSVVLASWTPSIEAIRFVEMGYFTETGSTVSSRPRVFPTRLALHGREDPAPGRLPSAAFAAAKDALRTGPVLVQVFRAGFAPGLVCTDCGARARCSECGGPLAHSGAGAPASCAWCQHLHARFQCAECRGVTMRPSGQGVGRTVTELGKAFPGVQVVRADGEHRLATVPAKPALIVATRGAEPVAEGGYHAALLLDGAAMLQRSSLNVLHETLSGWEWALSLLAQNAVAYLTDIDGPVATACAAGTGMALLADELRERTSLRLPPAVRIAAIDGPAAVVEEIIREVSSHEGLDSLGRSRIEGTAVREIIRMPYRIAPQVAEMLRAAVVKDALSGRRGARLRVRMDDTRALDQLADGAL